MIDLDPSAFETMSPEEFAQLAKQLSDREVTELMSGELRVPILDAIFARFPTLFRADRARGLTSTTQFRITGGPEDHPQDTYEVRIADGECEVVDPGGEYDVSFMMAPPEFLKMTTGRGKPTILVMRGKIKVKGDLAAAAAFPTLFDIPKA